MTRPLYNNVDRNLLIRLSVGYLLLIVYGSLVPFNLNELTLSTAWENFQQIPLLKLEVANRADLVANLLLYVPLGLLICGGLVGGSRGTAVLAGGILLSLLLSSTVALVLEFIQQFFAPRTVSLNDIYAEVVGSGLGIALWPTVGARLVHLVHRISQGGTYAWYPILRAYALVYAALSLFPYDFLLSYNELHAKLTSGNVSWLFAANCGGGRCIARLIPEALLVAPLGVLIFGSAPRASFLIAAVAGAMLGALIEGLQLILASGISQGASIASRAIGMMLGVGLIRYARDVDWAHLRQHMRPFLVLATVPYLVTVAWLNGWFSHHWSDLSEAWTRLADAHFLPFYYHYYSTETAAVISLLFQAALYLPVGVGYWLWAWTSWRWPNRPKRDNAWPAIAAGLLASIIEGGKLFIPGKHPDPTNVLIAAMTAMVASRVLYLLLSAKPGESTSTPTDARPVLEPVPAENPFSGKAVGSLIAICLAIGAALTTPLGMQWVLPLLVAYMALLWFKPDLWLVCVTAFLPLLDFTSSTGRLFWSEYDTLLLATIGIGYLRLGSQLQPAFRRPARLLVSLFVLSAAISFGIGLSPLGPFDHNSFANYSSPYNTLRVAKGLLFSLAFIPLLTFEWDSPARAARKLATGVTLGLAGTIAYILWERVTFPGLFNFETEYRITGPFPGMHVGGAYIEGYLTAALPFVALFAWQQRKVWATLLAVGLYSLGTYSVMVTFSRGGQVAFALSTLIVLLGFARLALKKQGFQHSAEGLGKGLPRYRFSSSGALVFFAGLAAVAAAFAWPVVSGKYSQSRWVTTGADFSTRTSHWEDALNIVRTQNASFFGLGLGSFPSEYFWNSATSSRPATYTFATENGNSLLRLGSGDLLYFEQAVPVVPEQVYTLKLDVRASTRNSALTVKLCEKALLYSYTCTSAPLKITTTGQWEHHEVKIHTAGFGPPGSQFKRPTKLSLYNNTAGTIVDLDNVVLQDRTGNNLIQNGEFSSGMHHWFFSVDNYLPWHVENLYVNIFFEQGWFGIISFLSLIAYTLVRWLSRAHNNDSLSLVLCAALIAFLAVGTLNSWGDEPRLSFLFYLLLLAGLVADARSGLMKQANPLGSRQ